MRRRYEYELPANQKGHYAVVVVFLLGVFALIIVAADSTEQPISSESPTQTASAVMAAEATTTGADRE